MNDHMNVQHDLAYYQGLWDDALKRDVVPTSEAPFGEAPIKTSIETPE